MTKNILKMALMLVAMMLPYMAFAQKQTFALYDEPTGCPDWEPELTVFVAKNPNGMAILACPGGGYQGLAMDHEGFNMADWFNMVCFVIVCLTATRPFHWPMPRRPCA